MLVNQNSGQQGILVKLADAVEEAFKKVSSGMDSTEFRLDEGAAGVRLEILFLFCLADVMVRFYLLK